VTDADLDRLAAALADRMATRVVDELLGRLASRPANDTRQPIKRKTKTHVPEWVDDVAVAAAERELRARGIRVR
jgi:hypothetical protein